jgi:hypothetical protein
VALVRAPNPFFSLIVASVLPARMPRGGSQFCGSRTAFLDRSCGSTRQKKLAQPL